jgi:hypothetical protein
MNIWSIKDPNRYECYGASTLQDLKDLVFSVLLWTFLDTWSEVGII